MDPQAAFRSQFQAAIRTLRKAIETCPDDLWTDDSFGNTYWRVAYHALHYTHLYLSPSEAQFSSWPKAREHVYYLGDRLHWPPHDEIVVGEPYSKADLIEYADRIEAELPSLLDATSLESESGFEWIPFGRFELHLYNLRHAQHHAGQLIERLRTSADTGVGWIGHGD